MARRRAEFGLRSSGEGDKNLSPHRKIETKAKTPSSKEVPPLANEDPDPLKETLTGEFPGEAGGSVWPGTVALFIPVGSYCVVESPLVRKL